ncbi:MAG: methyltransferase domain-containing protein, partial [Bdellovibrionales bacterium]|nr:methyltransferase domain-containing protein [Bdellovibrionales bacterium]
TRSWYEVEVTPGLKELAIMELSSISPISQIDEIRDGFLVRQASESPLLSLRTAHAVSRGIAFEVPRPKALLGDEHFRKLCGIITEHLKSPGLCEARSFRLSAAGKDSAVFERLISSLENEIGLRYDAEQGDLFIRIRKSMVVDEGWDVLLRYGLRPLSKRWWRTQDYRGALDGPVAAGIALLTSPGKKQRVLDLCAGSGTFLIERALIGPALCLCGSELLEDVVALSQKNAEAAGVAMKMSFQQGDARALPFSDQEFDVVFGNLPWGEACGSKPALKALYIDIVHEAVRVCAPGGQILFLTQAHGVLRGVVGELGEGICLESERTFFQGGFHPRLFVLRKLK